jgi:leader peptidase (prepilin peptidase) / N-methyltransferase
MDSSFQQGLLSPPVLALLGLCIGSFLNVVIHRLPLMLERNWRIDSAEMLGLDASKAPAIPDPITLSSPRSRCASCGHQIAWHENVPLWSYFRLGGKCSACKTRISPRYPLVELLTAALFAASAWHVGAQPAALLWCGFMAALVALAFIDLDTKYLPDDLTLPLMWFGIGAAALGWIPVSLSASVWGAIAGYLSLWIVSTTYRLVRNREGMGAGDFKLLAALGAWMGWQLIPAIILLASVVGAVVGIALIVFKRHDHNDPIPFGPYLAGGGVAALFFGESLMRLWFPMP